MWNIETSYNPHSVQWIHRRWNQSRIILFINSKSSPGKNNFSKNGKKWKSNANIKGKFAKGNINILNGDRE